MHTGNVQAPVLATPVPTIEISPAPNKSKTPSPYNSPCEDDRMRPVFLSPPPRFSPRQLMEAQRSSTLPSTKATASGGLDRDRFESLLKASRERKAMLSNMNMNTKEAAELRREVTSMMKKNKQAERRARFLSKVDMAPSADAVDLPVTPPDSPAIFHFTLPSPGVVSPLVAVHRHKRLEQQPWVERVDFRPTSEDVYMEDIRSHSPAPPSLPLSQTRPLNVRRKPAPSLEDITSRYINQTQNPNSSCPSVSISFTSRQRAPLPAFLRRGTPSPSAAPPPSITKSKGPVTCVPRPGLQMTTSVIPIPNTHNSRVQLPLPSNPLTEANLYAFTRVTGTPPSSPSPSPRSEKDAMPPKNLNQSPDGSSSKRFSAPATLIEQDVRRIVGGF